VTGALVLASDITEHKRAEHALSLAHAELENRVALRTAQLLDVNLQLSAEIAMRAQTEAALARSEERLQDIISMMPLSLFLKDADSRIVLMNQACEQQWGVYQQDIAEGRDLQHFPEEQNAGFLAADQEAFASRQVVIREELVWNARLQENRLLQTHKKPIFDAQGRPQMIIAMGIDITESKRNEENLQRTLAQLRELSDHQQTIKEQERRRIALDIHDDLGQNLMVLRIDVSLLHARTASTHPHLHRHAQRVLDTIDATIRSVRTIINDLHPSTLELGLGPAAEWLIRQMRAVAPSATGSRSTARRPTWAWTTPDVGHLPRAAGIVVEHRAPRPGQRSGSGAGARCGRHRPAHQRQRHRHAAGRPRQAGRLRPEKHTRTCPCAGRRIAHRQSGGPRHGAGHPPAPAGRPAPCRACQNTKIIKTVVN